MFDLITGEVLAPVEQVRQDRQFPFSATHHDAGLFKADLLFFGFDCVEFVARFEQAPDLDFGLAGAANSGVLE